MEGPCKDQRDRTRAAGRVTGRCVRTDTHSGLPLPRVHASFKHKFPKWGQAKCFGEIQNAFMDRAFFFLKRTALGITLRPQSSPSQSWQVCVQCQEPSVRSLGPAVEERSYDSQREEHCEGVDTPRAVLICGRHVHRAHGSHVVGCRVGHTGHIFACLSLDHL